MNLHAILHIPKSNYAYAYSKNELDIRLRTARGDCCAAAVVIAKKHNWQEKQTFIMKKIASDSLFDYYGYRYNTDDPRLGYYFKISDEKTTVIYSESGFSEDFDDENAYFHYFQYPYINSNDVMVVPQWVHNTVFYEIFVDRFYNGDNKNDPKNLTEWGVLPKPQSVYGGDLQGIIDKLGYLFELGINGIYLTPIFQSPSNHKYDTTYYLKVDKMFGDKKTLCNLVTEAHKKGIRIILDGVFNHACWDCEQFKDVLQHSKNSKYKDWFCIESFPLARFSEEEVNDYSKPLDLSRLNYKIFGTSPSMPKLNTANPDVQKYLIDMVTMWTKDTGIDGWRLDVSDEVSHGFWRKFRDTVKSINEDAIIIGENWHNSYPWLQGDQFDGVMNYPVTKSCIQYFALNQIDARHFADDLSSYLMNNFEQVDYSMLNLLDSHDTNRFLTWCGSDKRKLKLAVMVLFCYIGMPCIYYGSEIGMEGEGDPDCRRTFDWNEDNWDKDLFNFYKTIIKLRKEEVCLKNGSIKMYAQDNVFYLERIYGGETITAAINNTDSLVNIKPLGKLLLSTEKIDENKLMPFSGAIFRRL